VHLGDHRRLPDTQAADLTLNTEIGLITITGIEETEPIEHLAETVASGGRVTVGRVGLHELVVQHSHPIHLPHDLETPNDVGSRQLTG